MILTFFSVFDLFRQPLMFYYNGSQKRTSFFGFLSSLIIYVYLFYSFSQSNMYLKKSPIVVVQNIETQNAPPFLFGENKFFAVGLSDSFNNRSVDPTLFKIQFRYFKNLTSFETRDLRPCELSDVQGNETLFKFHNMETMFCLKNKTFVLEGTIDENPSFVVISLFLCNNLTSNNTCKSQEEINSFFNSFTSQKLFYVFYQDTQVKLEDYDEPFKDLMRVDYQLIDLAVKKNQAINFKKVTVSTDSGWLFSNVGYKSSYLFSAKTSDFQIRSSQNQPLFQFNLFSSKEEITYARRYQTISEFLGGFAGMAKLISIICGVLVNNLMYIDTLKHILNKIYGFPGNPKKQKAKKRIKTSTRSKRSETLKSLQSLESKKEQQHFKSQREQPTFLTSVSKREQPDLLISVIEENLKTNPYSQNLQNILQEPENKINELSQIQVTSGLMNSKLINISQIMKKEIEKDSFSLEHFSENCVKEPNQNLEMRNLGCLGEKETANLEIEKCKNERDFFEIEKCKNESDVLKIRVGLNKKPEEEFIDRTPIKKDLKKLIDRRLCGSKLSFFKKPKKEEFPNPNQLQLSFWEYLSLFLDLFRSKKSSRHLLIEKAEKTFIEDLDVVNIVSKLHDLEKLKILLLDEDQLVIFNYISKPFITLENSDNKDDETISFSHTRLNTMINRTKNAKNHLEESYKKVLARKDDKVCEKLIDFFDKEIYKLK